PPASDAGTTPAAATGPPARPSRLRHTGAATRAPSGAPPRTGGPPPSPRRPPRAPLAPPGTAAPPHPAPPAHPAPSAATTDGSQRSDRNAGKPVTRTECRQSTRTTVAQLPEPRPQTV